MHSPSILIAVDNVIKTFGQVHAVDKLTFTVATGEVFALLGPNGAGKTTVVRMLAGIIRPDAGTVRFPNAGNGHAGLAPAQFGYLPEDRGLYQDVPIIRTLTFMGVIRGMDRRHARTAALEWLERFELNDRADEKLGVLSKGNQQKVQFIAAVLHKPKLAILDEPFSGLDPINQDLFLSIIAEMRKAGTTVLLSAHHMQLVERLADSVLLMDHGRAVLHGPLNAIRREHGEDVSLHDIYVKQVGKVLSKTTGGETQ